MEKRISLKPDAASQGVGIDGRILCSIRQNAEGRGTSVENVSVSDAVIEEIVQRIVAAARPYKVILFGSRARGEARPGSDLDILVIQDSTEPRYRRSVPLYAALADLPVEVEVVVYTPAEMEEWAGVRQALVTTALREGRVLYERSA